MPQYNISTNEYVERNNNLFDVVQQSDENGELWNKRYSKDAWGRPKSIHDFSVFNATYTFGVPKRIWEEYVVTNATTPGSDVYTPQPAFTANIGTRHHMLSVKSGTVQNTGHMLLSKKHPRYQSNRGHLYSVAAFFPNPTDVGIRRYGLSTPKDGIYFELVGDSTDWDLFAVRKTNSVITTRESIKAQLPIGFDPSKGHVYDVQFQWRGVGNYYFFVDLELIHTFNILGTLTELSLDDPALPVMYNAINTDGVTNVEINIGCVDVTSEGGTNERTLFNSAQSGLVGTINVAQTDTAILAIRVPRNITYDGSPHYNSRGAILDKLVTWTKAEARTRAFVIRDTNAPALSALTWTTISDSHIETLTGGSGSALQTAWQTDAVNATRLVSEWEGLDVKNIITNESANSTFEVTPGDIFVVCVATVIGNGASTSASIYFSEEI